METERKMQLIVRKVKVVKSGKPVTVSWLKSKPELESEYK